MTDGLPPSCRPEPAPDTPCDECGQFGAVSFAGIKLCADCYAASGSCCPGFGYGETGPTGGL
jgi:hypothetical protein